MIKEGEVIFNNNSSLSLNLFLEAYPSVPITTEEYEEIKVEGRSGNLIINKGTYPDKKITFSFTFLSPQIEIDFDNVYQWLTEIEDNRLIWGRSDRCYLVKKVVLGDLQKEFKSIGEFDVTFICEPFSQDLEESEVAIHTDNKTVSYLGTAEGRPLIKMNIVGGAYITCNGVRMEIYNGNGVITIDSQLMQVRDSNGNSKDQDTTGDFITLQKGNNVFGYGVMNGGQIKSIKVYYTNLYK